LEQFRKDRKEGISQMKGKNNKKYEFIFQNDVLVGFGEKEIIFIDSEDMAEIKLVFNSQKDLLFLYEKLKKQKRRWKNVNLVD